MIFNNNSNVKNLLPILRLNDPILQNRIQATLPQKLLYSFLQSEEGKIFKRASNFLSNSPLLAKNSSTFFIPSSKTNQIQRSNSNYFCSNIQTSDINEEVPQNILNEITTNTQNGSNKSLTRIKANPKQKQLTINSTFTLQNNKSQNYNPPVIPTSPIIKISPLGKTNSSFHNKTTTSPNNNSNQKISTSTNRPIIQNLVQKSNLNTQQFKSIINHTSKSPYIQLNEQNENVDPETPIGKSMFDQSQQRNKSYSQYISKTPTGIQTLNVQSFTNTSNALINNSNFSMTPLNTISQNNLFSQINSFPHPTKTIHPTVLIKPSILDCKTNPSSPYSQNNNERSRSITPIQTNNNSEKFGDSMFNNNNQKQLKTPCNLDQNEYDFNNQITPKSKPIIINFNPATAQNGDLFHNVPISQNNIQNTRSNSVNILVQLPSQNSHLNITQEPNTFNINNFRRNCKSGIQPLGVYGNRGTNIKIGQLLSQRATTPPPKTFTSAQVVSSINIPSQLVQQKSYLRSISIKDCQENMSNNSIKCSTPQNQSYYIPKSIIQNNSSSRSQSHKNSLVVQTNPSYQNIVLSSIYQSNSTTNQQSVVPTLNTPTAAILTSQIEPNCQGTVIVPCESVRNKFLQLRKITGVRKASQNSQSPINRILEGEFSSINNQNNLQQIQNISHLLNNQKSLENSQKLRSVSHLQLNNNYNFDKNDVNYNRQFNEAPFSCINSQNSTQQNLSNFINNNNCSSSMKKLQKNMSHNNIYSMQNFTNLNAQSYIDQKITPNLYNFDKEYIQNNSNNLIHKDISNLPSLSNISQIIDTQDDQNKSDRLTSTKVKNIFIPILSPACINNYGIDNSHQLASESQTSISNNKTHSNQQNIQSQINNETPTPKIFNFKQVNSYYDNIDFSYNFAKKDENEDDIKQNAKDQIQQIIQRTITREFEKLKQLTEETTQIEQDKYSRKFSEFTQQDDQKYQSFKNNQTNQDTENCYFLNTKCSINNEIRQNSLSQENITQQNNPQSRCYSNSFKEVINNPTQCVSQTSNINNMKIHDTIEPTSIPPNINKIQQIKARNNRFNSIQKEENDEETKKKSQINLNSKQEDGKEITAQNQIIQRKTLIDYSDSPCSLALQDKNNQVASDQINQVIKIFQNVDSNSCTLSDLNSFAIKNLESQRQGQQFNLNSDIQLQNSEQNQNKNPEIHNQTLVNQFSYQYNTAPKILNLNEPQQQNIVNYNTANGDIAQKRLQDTQIGQFKSNTCQNSYFSNQNYNDIETTPTSNAQNFPIQKIQFKKNSINGSQNTTPKNVNQVSKNKEINVFKQQNVFQDNELTPKNQNPYMQQPNFQAKNEDMAELEGRKRNKSSLSSQNEIDFYENSNQNTLKTNEKQRHLSILNELQINDQTPQKLINTATKQNKMDEIEKLRNGGQNQAIQFVSNKEIEEIRNNTINYLNDNQNNILKNQESQINSIHPQSEIKHLDSNLFQEHRPQTQNNISTPSSYSLKNQNDFSQQFNSFQTENGKSFEIHSKLNLQRQNPQNQSLTQNIQFEKIQQHQPESQIAFQKPPLQYSGQNKPQKNSSIQLQQQSQSKQLQSIFSNLSSPTNLKQDYQFKQKDNHSRNDSSLTQISYNCNNRLSTQEEQQLIAQSQEYRMNLKNSSPSFKKYSGSKNEGINQQSSQFQYLSQQQSNQNFQENYIQALNRQQYFSQQVSHEFSLQTSPLPVKQNQIYDDISEQDEGNVEPFSIIDQKDLIDQQQQEEEMNIQFYKNAQQNQKQLIGQQQQQNEEYYDDLYDEDNQNYQQFNNKQDYYENKLNPQKEMDKYSNIQKSEMIIQNKHFQNEIYYYQDSDRILEETSEMQRNQQNNIKQLYQNNNQQELQVQKAKPPTFYNNNFSNQQQCELSESFRESLQNNSLRSSKNNIDNHNQRFEDSLNSIKKQNYGLYNQTINFEGDSNFKQSDQQIYHHQYNQVSQFNNKTPSNNQYQFQQINNQFNNLQSKQDSDQIPFFAQQDRNEEFNNNCGNEILENSQSLSQISQSPPKNFENYEQDNYYQVQNNNKECKDNDGDANYMSLSNDKQQITDYATSIGMNPYYQKQTFQNKQQESQQNQFTLNNEGNNPETMPMNLFIYDNNDNNQNTNNQYSNQQFYTNNIFKQLERPQQNHKQQSIDSNQCFDTYFNISKNMHEFDNYEEQQQQLLRQQNKIQEESFYEGHFLNDINFESGKKDGQRSECSQENLSQRRGTSKQNRSRNLTSGENVKRKHISRRILNQSAKKYNELDSNRSQKSSNLEEFEAKYNKNILRESLQDFVDELNEISEKNTRDLLDLSQRIQHSNSLILDRSEIKEKSFCQHEKSIYQNEKVFNQNEKSFNQNERSFNQNDRSMNQNDKNEMELNNNHSNKNQSELYDYAQMNQTILTGLNESNKKENNPRTKQQRLSEYIISYNLENYLTQKQQSPRMQNDNYALNGTNSTAYYESHIHPQQYTSYYPSTSILQIPNQYGKEQQNKTSNVQEELLNNEPFVIVTSERRSNDRVDEISIKFQESIGLNKPSYSQKYQNFQQMNSTTSQQQNQNEENRFIFQNEKEDKTYSLNNHLQDSPFIEDRKIEENINVQDKDLQITSFAHSDNFISNKQISALPNKLPSLITPPTSTDAFINRNSEKIIQQENALNYYDLDQYKLQNKQGVPIQSNKPLPIDFDKENQNDKSIEEQGYNDHEKINGSSENLTQSKKIMNNQRTRPISEIPTESKFVKQRQPHFEDIINKEAHNRSQSNHTKKKKHFELSIEISNDEQKQQLHNHILGENKETPSFQEFEINSSNSGFFKSEKSNTNKREQRISFLEYLKEHEKKQ